MTLVAGHVSLLPPPIETEAGALASEGRRFGRLEKRGSSVCPRLSSSFRRRCPETHLLCELKCGANAIRRRWDRRASPDLPPRWDEVAAEEISLRNGFVAFSDSRQVIDGIEKQDIRQHEGKCLVSISSPTALAPANSSRNHIACKPPFSLMQPRVRRKNLSFRSASQPLLQLLQLLPPRPGGMPPWAGTLFVPTQLAPSETP